MWSTAAGTHQHSQKTFRSEQNIGRRRRSSIRSIAVTEAIVICTAIAHLREEARVRAFS